MPRKESLKMNIVKNAVISGKTFAVRAICSTDFWVSVSVFRKMLCRFKSEKEGNTFIFEFLKCIRIKHFFIVWPYYNYN